MRGKIIRSECINRRAGEGGVKASKPFTGLSPLLCEPCASLCIFNLSRIMMKFQNVARSSSVPTPWSRYSGNASSVGVRRLSGLRRGEALAHVQTHK